MKTMLWVRQTGLAGFLFLGLASSGWAAPAPEQQASGSFSVEAQADRSTITIGDPVVYVLTVRRQPKVIVTNALQIPSSPDFEVSRVEDFQRKEDGWILEGKKVTLTSFRLGEFVLDSIPVTAKDPKGKIQTLSSPRIYITVVSTQKGGAPANDIRGIKSVVEIPFRFIKKYAVWIAAFAFLITAAFLIWRRFKKMKGTEIELRRVLSPEDEAFGEMHTLFDSTLLRQGKTKAYFFKLSEILRTYFEKRYLIFAVEATTGEILRLLRQKEVPSDLLEETREVLEMCDLAKFAKWKPEPLEVLKLNQMTESIVKKAAAQNAVPNHGI